MALTFTLNGKSYAVKDYDELTLADWKALSLVKPSENTERKEREYAVAILAAHTGIPKAKLRQLSAASWDAAIEAIADTLKLAKQDHERHFTDGTWEAPSTYVFDGVTYAVPRDIDNELTTGQWFDLEDAKAIEHEADVIRATLAICLVPQGEKYTGSQGREEAFKAMPVKDAFALSAFFFAGSERYRNAIGLLSNRFLLYCARTLLPAGKSSPSTMEASPALSAPPS